MKVLVLGAGGQVGRELMEADWPAGWRIDGRRREETDLADAAAIGRAIEQAAPHLVVNAGAYTSVDRAESERDLAFAINADAPGAIGRAAAAASAAVVHYSTDYVFDGEGEGARRESDPVRPLGVYGASKEAGERALREALRRHVILRTSWVFAAHGNNFVRTMLRLGAERPELRVVDDQRGGPTAAASIAAATVEIARQIDAGLGKWGTFHFAGTPATTWHGFAAAIFEGMARRTGRRPALAAIPTSAYPTPAKRPANSVLDLAAIERAYGITAPDWRDDLDRVLDVLLGPAREAKTA